MGSIYALNITNSNTSYLIEPTLYANANGTAAAITATITNFELIPGVAISLKINTTNAANATLSINSGIAKSIYYNNTAITAGILKENLVYNLVYDGTVWRVIGEKPPESAS